MYLIKRISHSGYCSRREAEILIRGGQVYVAGEKITDPATQVDEDTPVKVEGKLLKAQEKTRVFAFHKPIKVLTTHKDDKNRQTIFHFLPKWMKQYHAIGRLDFMSEGLILLTNSATLKEKMERGDLERVYEVKIKGPARPTLKETLEKGIRIKGIKYKPVQCAIGRKNEGSTWLTLTLTEGKNREIREILGHLGYTVLRLMRVSYGKYKLGELERGELFEYVEQEKIKKKK
ncbi:MAG: rRNA pseudouridine synthase [Alphaproteobacteria bacterium]|nr:rRNA pseudouridine synthase [Alphaproteobacteria bacterium]MBN2779951.1 rRNA pseudouridine synthase [Alphaproteobacteria bacterium]